MRECLRVSSSAYNTKKCGVLSKHRPHPSTSTTFFWPTAFGQSRVYPRILCPHGPAYCRYLPRHNLCCCDRRGKNSPGSRFLVTTVVVSNYCRSRKVHLRRNFSSPRHRCDWHHIAAAREIPRAAPRHISYPPFPRRQLHLGYNVHAASRPSIRIRHHAR